MITKMPPVARTAGPARGNRSPQADAPPGPAADLVVIPVRLCNLPPFPAIANQVMAMTADPEVDFKRLTDVIESDPAFAADILFLANSSLFGFPSRVSALRSAVALLGLDRITAMAVTVGMRVLLGRQSDLVHACWHHSAACAIICETLASLADLSPDRAFTAGIMHDVGRLGLLKSYPADMGPILKAEWADLEDLLRTERETFQVDHARAGAWLVEQWNLPKEFAAICGEHHEPRAVGDAEIVQLVKAACNIANFIGFAAAKRREQPSYESAVASLKSLKLRSKTAPSEEEMRASVTARLAAFEH